MPNNVIYAQSIYDLVTLKKRVDPFELLEASEAFYRSVKCVGINNTRIKYRFNIHSEFEFKQGLDIPLEMRALCAFISRLYHRWDDNNLMRLEEHYGLPTSIENVLSHTGIFQNGKNLPCISIEHVIDKYLN